MGPDIEDADYSGLIPRMVFNIFHAIGMADPNLEFTIKISYCEIYLEMIRDLINPEKNNLAIKEDRIKGFYISDLTEEFVSTEEEIMDTIKFGNYSREVGFTNMNA